MIELNESLQRALDAQKGEPLRLLDPRTRQTYVLMPTGLRERPGPDASGQSIEVPPGIRRSREAFLRDLPSLLGDPKNRDLWVAYHGQERIGIARDPATLIREIRRRGIAPAEYDLAVIRPQDAEPEDVEPIHPNHFQDLPAPA